MKIIAPKGTKDVLPEESYKWQYIERSFDRLCAEYGFQRIQTPVFEHTELFNRGVGDTTDIVQKEMYTFLDQGERSITLRPEGTSPVVRSFVENNLFANVQPSKFYYDVSCFRYEKPQAGRLREFHQFGVEIFGSSNMLSDAEVISLADRFLREMGLSNLELHISSVGCRECRAKHRTALQEFLKPHYEELCDTCKNRFNTNPMRILDCKSQICQSIVKDAPQMLDYLCDDCKSAFLELKSHLDRLKIKYVVDPSIVRGLDYYTKTAFEFISGKSGQMGTICGGGRYDHLIEEIGGPDMPGVGFGLGKERLLLMMEEAGSTFGGEIRPTAFVAYQDAEYLDYSLDLVQELRQAGISTVFDCQGRNLKGQLKYAAKSRAKFSIIIGEEEIKSSMLSIKDMDESKQTQVSRQEIKEFLGEQNAISQN